MLAGYRARTSGGSAATVRTHRSEHGMSTTGDGNPWRNCDSVSGFIPANARGAARYQRDRRVNRSTSRSVNTSASAFESVRSTPSTVMPVPSAKTLVRLAALMTTARLWMPTSVGPEAAVHELESELIGRQEPVGDCDAL